jgi:hypothetical protein
VAALDVLNAAEKSSTRHVLRRRWRSFDVTAFAADLQQSRLVAATPTDVDELFNCYDSTLRSLLDKHAPACRSTIRCNPAAPWYDEECCKCKATTRKRDKICRAAPSAPVSNTLISISCCLFDNQLTGLVIQLRRPSCRCITT